MTRRSFITVSAGGVAAALALAKEHHRQNPQSTTLVLELSDGVALIFHGAKIGDVISGVVRSPLDITALEIHGSESLTPTISINHWDEDLNGKRSRVDSQFYYGCSRPYPFRDTFGVRKVGYGSLAWLEANDRITCVFVKKVIVPEQELSPWDAVARRQDIGKPVNHSDLNARCSGGRGYGFRMNGRLLNVRFDT